MGRPYTIGQRFAASGRTGTLAAVIAALLCLATSVAVAADKLDVRVLYCGDPDSAREKDFCSFLEQHFTKVTHGDFHGFKEEQTRDHDVIVFDWTATMTADGPDLDKLARIRSKVPKLSPEYSRPTILVGEAGGHVAKELKIKIDWLCLCLDGPAHKLNLEHKIFHSPLEVGARLETMPTRKDYLYQSTNPDLGDTMQVWHVQTKNWPDAEPGLVSTLYGFTDSPDAEVFAQGVAMKGPDTVALARQGNFFLWGFSAAPSNMTPSGRRLFVNAVAYMRGFDGRRPLVHVRSSAREHAMRNALVPRIIDDGVLDRSLEEGFKANEAMIRKMVKEHPETLPKNFKDIESYLATIKTSLAKQGTILMENSLPADLRERFGMDSNKYLAYYTENLELLRPEAVDSHRFIVDEDAKSVGPSNRKIELLDRCVSMLERGDRPELATRLLARYTQEKFDSSPEWRAWLEKNRGQLFFSDVGGYKFFIGPAASSQTTDSSPVASRAARYATIVAEYEAQLKEGIAAVGEGKKNTEAAEIYQKLRADIDDCATRLMDLVKENPGDATAREALIWIFTNASPYRRDQRMGALEQQAGQALLNDHADHLDVAQAALQLSNTVSSDRDAFIEGLVAESHEREAHGLARIALAHYLMTKIGIVESCQAHRWDGITNGKTYGPSYVAHLHACNVADMRAKITNLLEQVIAETGDIPYVRYKLPKESELRRNMTQGKVAADLLDEFIHLAIGQPSPDIKGTDLDGKSLKLADYRGKVVVLVFWATWCGPCMAAVPHERELVERLKDCPFVLLGINCDEDRAAACKAIESEKISWRNWSDPLDTSTVEFGPIVKRFHVHSFPSIFVLDAAGIIRNKQVGGQTLDKAVDKLLEEVGQTAAQ